MGGPEQRAVPQRRRLSARLRLAGLLMCCLVAACTGGEADPPPTPVPTASVAAEVTAVPQVPVATEPPEVMADTPDPAAEAGLVTEAPVAGETVLVHLEGPPNDRQATDVVVRNESGAELTRYRVAGAASIQAAPGATTALIRVVPDGWVRYDAPSDSLVRVTFPGDAPGPTIRPGSGIAGPTAVWDPTEAQYLLRMDSGEVLDLRSESNPERVEALSRGGGVVVLRDTTTSGLSVLRTISGQRRQLDATSAMVSADGQLLGIVAPDGSARLEGLDGELVLDLGEVSADAQVLPLDATLALVLGGQPVLRGPGAASAAPDDAPAGDPAAPTPEAVLPTTVELRPPTLIAADGAQVLATTPDGLALVDIAQRAVTALPDTAGYAPIGLGAGSVLWARSADPTQPGLVAIRPADGSVVRMLPDTVTGAPQSISADGQTLALSTTAADGLPRSVVVTADGQEVSADLGPLDGAAPIFTALHPGGLLEAITVDDTDDLHLVLTGPDGAVTTIPTGRQPVWLGTAT